jgi:hypothetical protein
MVVNNVLLSSKLVELFDAQGRAGDFGRAL